VQLEPGDATTIKWRGKPIFIRHLTSEEIATVEAEDMANLRDVETHADRTKQANMLVCLGVCTHLGCVPIAKAGDWNGYFCPCHGSPRRGRHCHSASPRSGLHRKFLWMPASDSAE
jgi:ubiquinol-cytochrome c reductase iron-sulfur subunit